MMPHMVVEEPLLREGTGSGGAAAYADLPVRGAGGGECTGHAVYVCHGGGSV